MHHCLSDILQEQKTCGNPLFLLCLEKFQQLTKLGKKGDGTLFRNGLFVTAQHGQVNAPYGCNSCKKMKKKEKPYYQLHGLRTVIH